jgi:hypothetical protein
MYYVMGNMTPHREPAWALLAERARLLAHGCRRVAADPSDDALPSPAISVAAEHAQDIANSLTAQVPWDLLPSTGQEVPT